MCSQIRAAPITVGSYIGNNKHEFAVDHLDIAALVILKELFNDPFLEFSE